MGHALRLGVAASAGCVATTRAGLSALDHVVAARAAGEPSNADGLTGLDDIRLRHHPAREHNAHKLEEVDLRLRLIAGVLFVIAAAVAGLVLAQVDSSRDAWLVFGTGLALAALVGALALATLRRRRALREVDRYFTLASEMVTVAGFDGYWTRVNPAVEAVLGYSEREALERPVMELVHPEDRERSEQETRRVLEGSTAHGVELRMLCKDGSYKWIEWTATPIPEERMMYGIGRDVTERRRNEQEQAAVQRISTLVAQEVPQADVFAAIVEEIAALVGTEEIRMLRFEGDTSAVLVGRFGRDGAFPLDSHQQLEGDSLASRVRRTGEPVRLDGAAVAVPVCVNELLWGALSVASTDGEPLPPDTEARLLHFTELTATAIAKTEARDALALLAEEQAALRRVATLVADESSPVAIFSAVTEEARRVLRCEAVGLLRFEPDETATLIAQSDTPWEPPPLGTGFTLDGENVIVQVSRTGLAARADDWSDSSGSVAAMATVLGVRSAVASPVVVEGRLWGTIIAATSQSEPLPAETELRIAQFTGLIATAIANAESHRALARLAEEQAALRRVATLVARGIGPEEVFRAVAAEVGTLFGGDVSAIVRFEDDGTVTVLGDLGGPHVSGKRVSLDEGYVVHRVRETGRSARFDTDDPSAADMPSLVRALGVRSSVASPIVVEGELWGAITAASVEGPLPPSAERRLTEFTELVATAVANTQSREHVAALAEEQAALRRVATLVAEDAPPAELFRAVTVEVGTLLGVDFSGMARVAEGAVLPLAVWAAEGEQPVLPDQWPMQAGDPTSAIAEARRTYRLDDWGEIEGPHAQYVRGELGVRSTVGTPIIVEGLVWGVLAVHSRRTLPPGSESRIEQFSDLVATAIGNAEARAEVGRLANEQAALRRVATLVADGAPPAEVFEAVAAEVGEVLDANLTLLCRYDGDGTATAIGSTSPEAIPVGTRSSLGGRNVLSIVAETGRPARIDDYANATGEAADTARRFGFRSGIAAPIVVEGRVWGVMALATQHEQAFPVGDETRLAQFTDLAATAVGNAEARAAVQRAADEQGALRRVATLVAASAAPREVFAAVTEEIALVLRADASLLCRADRDGAAEVVGTAGDNTPRLGTRIPRGGTNLTTIVLDTGRPARIESYDDATGEGSKVARSHGLRSAVGAPIVVEGRLWGLVIAGTTRDEPLPPDAEERLTGFTELVATAIANAEAQYALERAAAEQATLRRIATLVATGVEPAQVFAAVAEETAATFHAITRVMRFEHDPPGVVIVGASQETGTPVGTRWAFEEGMASAEVYRTGRSARVGDVDWSSQAGPVAEAGHRLGVSSQVSCPIIVEGSLWGVISVNAQEELPLDTEERLEGFTELVTTAIANAEGKSELAASRRRIVAASDETRRQIERDLHDGTQQRLVSLGLAVRAAEASLPPERDDLRAQLSGVATGLVAAVEDLQEISRGIHPAILSKGGLGPALQALAHRSAIPVQLDIRSDVRPEEPIEVAAYFVASEALANAAKHSQASRVDVSLEQRDGRLLLAVRDDGVGGAEAARGSGLVGLTDRVEALGGWIRVSSLPGKGTEIAVDLPVELKLAPTTG